MWGAEGPADTVYLGVFRRTALDRVGGYDEDFVRAQDWEMNYRIRTTGGTVCNRSCHEVAGVGASPLLDRDRRVVGRGEEDGQDHRQRRDHGQRDDEFLDQVVAHVLAAPLASVIGWLCRRRR